MKARLIVLAAIVVVALGVAVAVWAASDSGSDSKPESCQLTITVQDTQSPRMMEYHRDSCDEEFVVERS